MKILENLRAVLGRLTEAQYGRDNQLDDQVLDDALDAAFGALRRLKIENAWVVKKVRSLPPVEGQRGKPSMVPIAQIGALLRDGLTAWRNVRLADVLFGHLDTTILVLIVLAGLSAGVAVIRMAFGRRPGRAQVGLPALLSWARSPSLPFLRHGALLLALAGLPFFMLALADPYTQLQQQELSFPGRRIAMMIDASASMVAPFQTGRLKQAGPEPGDVLYGRRRRRNLHPPAHERQVPGSDRARGVRRRGVRR